MTVIRDERRWRDLLGSIAFWVILAYFLLAAVVIILYFVNGARRRDEALHRGEVIAAARGKVEQCLSSRPILMKTDAFIHAVADFHRASLANAVGLLRATARSNPDYRTRAANVRRLRATVPPVAALRFHIPTRAECLALGDTTYGRIPPNVTTTRR